MSVSKKDVEKIAELAKLKFSDEELNNFTADMNNILDYMDKLNELNTQNVQPLAHLNEQSNVFREDKVERSVSTDEALKNAPSKDDKYFKVPKVIREK